DLRPVEPGKGPGFGRGDHRRLQDPALTLGKPLERKNFPEHYKDYTIVRICVTVSPPDHADIRRAGELGGKTHAAHRAVTRKAVAWESVLRPWQGRQIRGLHRVRRGPRRRLLERRGVDRRDAGEAVERRLLGGSPRQRVALAAD